ncbi:sigma factor-like helix-turn-helix DNA-binding protein [Actinomycetospora cinnamomea]|uniref:RNA polymerase sigma-70 factor (ECF subfamily) n=1 Tax=Actinomycetospora cinnamomea TaxID=663609 RepID=A0A2U1F713_9PSEU|nr:sigma factor-like helix-turn-helix DNA-binding protein [Actinomycetospora cinnamomea]PVZ07958.1 RNA polymerase sigma-70 factor (ECF subfamily) [Actinomycetospora cinnamomea]
MSRDDFEEFLVDHVPRLGRLAWALAIQSGADHHELVSGTVRVLYRRWPTIRPPIAATRWAFARTTMVNLARSEERRARARGEVPADDLQEVLDRTLRRSPWDDDPAFAMVCREEELTVYRAIRRLPPAEREIMMVIVQDFSWPETAAVLGIAVKDVRAGVLRARRRLRGLLKEDDGDA